jgi:hypothetical protein
MSDIVNTGTAVLNRGPGFVLDSTDKILGSCLVLAKTLKNTDSGSRFYPRNHVCVERRISSFQRTCSERSLAQAFPYLPTAKAGGFSGAS